MNKLNKTIILAALPLLAGCAAFDDAEYTVLQELAYDSRDTFVPVEGGEAKIPVYSNGAVKVKVLTDIDGWASVDKTEFNGDDTLKVVFEPNGDFRRMVSLELSLDDGAKIDTVYAKQYGTDPYLDCNAPFASVDGSDASYAIFYFNTNIDLAEISSSIQYLSGSEGWIRSVVPDGNEAVLVETLPNPGDHMSKALVKCSWTDKWNQEFKASLFITASGRNGEFGTEISWDEARALAGSGVISEDKYVKGVIISDWHSKNMALNENTNYDTVDITTNDRTAYIESPDGSCGFKLVFKEADDNILVAGTAVTMSLQGLEITREENPERYSILGINPDCMVESKSGGVIPEKRLKISQLTDRDIYTCVTLTDTEFEYKEGAYANVYENYTLKSEINSMCSGNNNRFDGWAALLVDDEGRSIYAPINMLCLWRRNVNKVYELSEGSYGVPQGKGDTYGIVVSEDIHRYGDCGRYQIRVLDESGFRQELEGASSYTTLAKWNGSPWHYRWGQYGTCNEKYITPTGIAKRLEYVLPSDDISASHPVPVAELWCENHSKSSTATDSSYPLASSNAYCALVVTSSGIGDRGIASKDNNDILPKALYLTHEIKGWYKWEDNKVVGYNGLVIKTSTKDLKGTKMHLSYAYSVGTISATTSQNFPAHWCVEYSIDGGTNWTICPDTATGKEFTHLHTLPWYDTNIAGVKYFTSSSCGLGATEHLSLIPDDVFGQESVLFRIRPYDDVMAVFPIVWNGEVENAHIQSNTSANTYINFEYIKFKYIAQ